MAVGGSSQNSFRVDTREFAAFYRRTADIDKKAARAINKKLRDIAKPMVAEVGRAAKALPSKNERDPYAHGLGLRDAIAEATEVKVSQSLKKGTLVRIRVSGTKFAVLTGGKYKKLPRYVEGLGKKPWRHPVYADEGSTGGTWSGAWAEQKATPFMVKTLMKHKAQVREALAQVFLDVVNKELNK